MHRYHFSILVLGAFILMGCQTTRQSVKESDAQMNRTLEAVAEGVTGNDLSREDIKKLDKQLRHDKQAQSAVQSISGAVTGQVNVKYCPVDGERYSASVELCPTHNVTLKPVEE